MTKERKSYLKSTEYSFKPYILNGDGKQQSREIAYKYIYRKNRDKYPLRFREYVIHHIDGDTFNNSIKNLFICTKEEHNIIHYEQFKTKQKFQTTQEIELFFKTQKNSKQIRLNKKEESFKEVKTEKDQKENKNWFSWGWFIFWCILYFPVAIIYIIIKNYERKI